MDDLISKHAAISAIQAEYVDSDGGRDRKAIWQNVGLSRALSAIQDVPFTQSEIIQCKDCKHSVLVTEKWIDSPETKEMYACEIVYGINDKCGFCSRAEREEKA